VYVKLVAVALLIATAGALASHVRSLFQEDGISWRYARLVRYSLRQWRGLSLVIVGTFGFVVTAAAQPWPLKVLVDNAIGGEAVPSALRRILDAFGAEPTPGVLVISAGVVSVLLVAVNALLNVMIQWGWTVAGQRMVYDLAGDLFHKLQRLSLLFHGRREVGDSLSRLSGDTYAVYGLTDSLLITPIHQMLTLATVGYAAWLLDPQLALITMAAGPLMTLSSRYFGRQLKQRARWNREARARLLGFVHQTLTSMPIVHAYSAEGRNVTRFRALSDDAVASSQGGVIATLGFSQVNGFIGTVGTAAVTYLGAVRVLDGSLSLGSLLVLLAYLRTLQTNAQSFLDTYGSLRTASASVERVLEVLEEPEDIVDRPGAQPLPQRARGDLRIEQVTFGYEPGRPAITDVAIEVEPGQLVALVGRTGAGKSTIASMIPRFYDPWAGRVTLDGHDIRDLTVASLRSQVAVVLQEPFLLPLSVADNIAYGRRNASRDEIEVVARAAQAHEFIESLPDGYDTIIAERGASLSGGERQRIAIARALLRDSPVLVLDEPTAALDAETEHALTGALTELIRDRTTIVIAHRLSTIERADKIVVVDDGRIVEVGTHQDLLEANGRYARLQLLHAGEALPVEASA
jgi:ATP-binding cassette subfamily B protein/subfamily B ATP-binding cassette protein MsbA